jgi:glycosyltransferase 2 family protein
LNSKNKIILTILLIILFYALFVVFNDIEKISIIYAQLDLSYLIPIFGILMFTIFVRSQIQLLLLNSLGIKLTIKQNYVLFLSGLSMIITPIGSGQMIKSHYMEQKYGHPFSKTLPLVFTERFLDFSAIIFLIWTTLLFYTFFEPLMLVSASTSLLLFVLLFVKNKKLRCIIQSKFKKNNFLTKKFPKLDNFEESILTFSNFRTILIPFLLTLFVTFLEGFVIYLGFLIFNVEIDYFHSIQIFYTSILLGIFSIIPGGIGVTEGSFITLMILHNFELVIASSLIIFLRLITIWFVTFLGFIATYVISKK